MHGERGLALTTLQRRPLGLTFPVRVIDSDVQCIDVEVRAGRNSTVLILGLGIRIVQGKMDAGGDLTTTARYTPPVQNNLYTWDSRSSVRGQFPNDGGDVVFGWGQY